MTEPTDGDIDVGRATRIDERRIPPHVEVLLLLAAPLLLLFPLRAELFGRTNMIDPYLHTAIIQHGRELLERFGYDNRQFARAGFTVPGRPFVVVFGDIRGYYAFRFVLILVAIVPAYLLFTRLHGRWAGAVAVGSVIVSSVIVRAWSSDYPDSAAVSYLIAGYCCLFMPQAGARPRWPWLVASAAWLTLALHSNFVALPLVLTAWAAYAISYVADWRHVIRAAGTFAGVFAAVSALLSLTAWIAYGSADIFRPTWHAFVALRRPENVAVNHSSNWEWILDAPYLLVPPLVLVVGVVLARGNQAGVSRAERLLWLTLAFQCVVCVVMQFRLQHPILEFHFYSSLLWAMTTLLTASIVCQVAHPLLIRSRLSWVPATVLICVPVGFEVLDLQLSLKLVTAVLVIVATTLLVHAAHLSRSPVAGLLGLVLFALVAHALVVGQPPHAPYRPGQALLPRPRYAEVFAGINSFERDRYAVVSELDTVVPGPSRRNAPLVIWGADQWSETASIAASQYGWRPKSISGLPRLDDRDVAHISDIRADIILLLSDTGNDLAPAQANIRRIWPNADVLTDITLKEGRVRLYVSIVRIAP